MLRRIRDFLAEQYFRWLQGMQTLTLTNFILLVVAVSDKLKGALGIASSSEFVIIFVPIGICAVWLAGYIMESKIKFTQEVVRQGWKRNPALLEIAEGVKEINERLDRNGIK